MSGQLIRGFGTRQRKLSEQTAIFRKDAVQVFLTSEVIENESRRPGLDLTWVLLETGIDQALPPPI